MCVCLYIQTGAQEWRWDDDPDLSVHRQNFFCCATTQASVHGHWWSGNKHTHTPSLTVTVHVTMCICTHMHHRVNMYTHKHIPITHTLTHTVTPIFTHTHTHTHRCITCRIILLQLSNQLFMKYILTSIQLLRVTSGWFAMVSSTRYICRYIIDMLVWMARKKCATWSNWQHDVLLVLIGASQWYTCKDSIRSRKHCLELVSYDHHPKKTPKQPNVVLHTDTSFSEQSCTYLVGLLPPTPTAVFCTSTTDNRIVFIIPKLATPQGNQHFSRVPG